MAQAISVIFRGVGRSPRPIRLTWPLDCSQWGCVEDEASESMTPRKPAALSTLSGLLTRPQPNLRSYLVLLGVMSFVQLLVLVVLGGGLTITRNVLERVDIAIEGADLAAASVSRALRIACGKFTAAGPTFEAINCLRHPCCTSFIPHNADDPKFV